MRLFLDAHVSGRRVGEALRHRGDDVRAADEERDLDGWSDEDLLELATAEGRVVVTCDVKDFAPLVQSWAERGRRHAGCVLVAGLRHDDFGALLHGLGQLFEQRSSKAAWLDYVCWLSASEVFRSARRPPCARSCH